VWHATLANALIDLMGWTAYSKLPFLLTLTMMISRIDFDTQVRLTVNKASRACRGSVIF
jgi:hypothetical protein